MRVIGIAAAVAIGAAAVASGEVTRSGNLLVRFDGGIVPKKLPRHERAPVAIGVGSTIRATDGSDPPPQLRSIVVGINREGRVFDRGLPTCEPRLIQPATVATARRICGRALVGKGEVTVRVDFGDQKPFNLAAPMLVFNAKPAGGARRILAQIYSSDPPSSLILPFRIRKRRGVYGTVIATRLPRHAWDWAYVIRFEMWLRRTYAYRGGWRSYVSASCAAPPGFPGAVYPFAKARFGFADGRKLTSELVRTCTVR